MPYQRYETELFRERLARIRRSDKGTAEQIDQVLDRILANPYGWDGLLKGPRAGQCKKKAVNKKYRIIYKFCRLCLKLKKEKCSDCELPDDAVIFRDVFARDEGYD
jgi:hypothetical protein